MWIVNNHSRIEQKKKCHMVQTLALYCVYFYIICLLLNLMYLRYFNFNWLALVFMMLVFCVDHFNAEAMNMELIVIYAI
ncbi:hypothetical protein VNO77_43506 [Canavalia gladiata]|uniref:Uncharacterized protein n=1 Tax=Canavalia gladiata TaxID=3824 RepID=A0AAN9PMZ4_CANGL